MEFEKIVPVEDTETPRNSSVAQILALRDALKSSPWSWHRVTNWSWHRDRLVEALGPNSYGYNQYQAQIKSGELYVRYVGGDDGQGSEDLPSNEEILAKMQSQPGIWTPCPDCVSLAEWAKYIDVGGILEINDPADTARVVRIGVDHGEEVYPGIAAVTPLEFARALREPGVIGRWFRVPDNLIHNLYDIIKAMPIKGGLRTIIKEVGYGLTVAKAGYGLTAAKTLCVGSMDCDGGSVRLPVYW